MSIERIGRSLEGRNLILIRISSGGSDKPLIYIEAAIHAREWIAPPVALYIINQLVENPDYAYLYENIDWAIIPVVNPDGYEYTHVDVSKPVFRLLVFYRLQLFILITNSIINFPLSILF